MNPRPRLSAAAALGACAAALIPAAALGASPTAGPSAAVTPVLSAASAPACATSQLVVWLDTQGNGAAGSVFYSLELTNLAGHPCTVHGYPGVSAVSLAGRTLGSAAARDHTTTPHVITLMPGANATAVLRIVDAGNFPSATCHPVTAAGLRVFPPGSTTSKIVPFPFSACSSAGPVYLTVRAVGHA